jgi:hypothetical protein
MAVIDDDDDDHDDDGIRGEPWCRDFEAHKSLHEFCEDHQAMWCRKCDRGCPECVDDPHCPDCHCSLFCDEHDWDCSYYGEDD